ncbi:DUF3352 domain-containing protein [Leptothoe spongobia]|uniref:DUF3352 domain-containing protein n=1 Tax=Leptothoe spongobia TAU-MAC 1115 TaxID=1967444 RepID=A0A947DF10_9CYAN|nr:DUF3352 domain-containing protein [Leptothoe spongobia]MBT9315454.1 DUF3352 domain-containing protein [Leptothoe spongobia TAU-MAC 1115]
MVNVLGRGWWRRITVAIAAFLVIGLHGCAQVAIPVGQSHDLHSTQLLEFVPKQSLFATVIDTNVETNKVWQRSNLSDALFQAEKTIFGPYSIDLSEDIRPWLGDKVAVAITDKDLDRDRRNGRQVGYLLVAHAADGDALREFLELFWQRQSVSGPQPVLTAESGVPIIAGLVAQGSRQLATAVVGGRTLLVANDIKVLRQSLRVAQAPDLQLPGNDCCTAAWISLRIPEFLDWLGVATPEKLPLMSAYQWQHLTAAIELYSQQLVIDTTLTGVNSHLSLSERARSTVKHQADGPNQYVPDSVAWAVMGYDLQSLLTMVKDELAHYQRLPSPIQQGQRWLSTQLAQTLSEPLTQLLADDYAVGQLEDGTGLMAVRPMSPTVVDRLDRIAGQQGLTVSRLMLKGQSVTAWSRLKTRVDARNRETTVETDLVGVHTKIGDCHIFSTSIGGLTAALDAPANQLSASRSFQRALPSMDALNQEGYIYGTWSELDRLLASNRWFSLVKPIVQPWSQLIDAISITSYGQTANQSTGTVSILLKS